MEKHNQQESVQDLFSFFDLLARFDFEDQQKSAIDTDLLDSAPRGSVPATETNQALPLAEVKQDKQSLKHK